MNASSTGQTKYAQQVSWLRHLARQDLEDGAGVGVFQRSEVGEALNHTFDGDGPLKDALDEPVFTGAASEESSYPLGVVARALLAHARQRGWIEPDAQGDRRHGKAAGW